MDCWSSLLLHVLVIVYAYKLTWQGLMSHEEKEAVTDC